MFRNVIALVSADSQVCHDESSILPPPGRDIQWEVVNKMDRRVSSDSQQNIHVHDALGDKGAEVQM
ncbi:hypothetical protein SGX61_002467 [Raoultella ornithinolytica]|uniref:hypothetical protein n=1 Tax=Raoultella ornithinolytica TaxID=54291 RepID=UPI0015DC4D9B|nr:hypothetical protein [Raoultella ornithinolytica]EJD6651153.1 hypothetical protein [Raoultella ornithinolytica]ELV3661825.1 hypothetical protein [Raoultella ornithinolytica]BBT85805.1 hypothetical protein WP8W19C01_30460 [Raoultella ornithinolytica]